MCPGPIRAPELPEALPKLRVLGPPLEASLSGAQEVLQRGLPPGR